MQLFYSEHLNAGSSEFTFPEDESKHIVRVLRKKVGDMVHITNGRGYCFEAEIHSDQPKKCQVKVLKEHQSQPLNYRFHLVVAPTKSNDRFEWLLEKATEIGVDEISPIITEHSERKYSKHQRSQKVVQAAMKQSLRWFLPQLNEAVTFNEFLKAKHTGQRFIAHCAKQEKLHLSRAISPSSNITILIGPEGDFSAREIKLAHTAGFIPVSLGEHRLRTETAGLVATLTVNLVNQGLKL